MKDDESMFLLSVSAEALFEPWGVCGCLGMPFSQTAEEAQKACADISETKEKCAAFPTIRPYAASWRYLSPKRTFKIFTHL
jgi:hypothetical protein